MACVTPGSRLDFTGRLVVNHRKCVKLLSNEENNLTALLVNPIFFRIRNIKYFRQQSSWAKGSASNTLYSLMSPNFLSLFLLLFFNAAEGRRNQITLLMLICSPYFSLCHLLLLPVIGKLGMVVSRIKTALHVVCGALV